MNTSPLCIVDMGQPSKLLMNTHNAQKDIKECLKVKPKVTTQIDCVPLIRQKDDETQTDCPKDDCLSCKNEEHLILQRQVYIHLDTVKKLSGKF